MKIYTNEKGEIKDVGFTINATLIEQDINDDDNPFEGWSDAKICCYKVTVKDGTVLMYTPYVDSRLIEHIDQLGRQVEAVTPWTASKTAYIGDSECIFNDVPSGNMTVYCPANYTVERMDTRVTVYFEPLEEVTEITISII